MSTATPKKPTRKYRRLSDRGILRQIKQGTLMVDVFEGDVYRLCRRTGEWIELTYYFDKRMRRWVRIYSGQRRRGIMLNRLVWIAAHRRPIPKGHEVHHKDRNRHNYCWSNLECLESEAHKKKHEA